MMNSIIDLLKNKFEIEIGVYGRKTGRLIVLPVWFVLKNNELFLLPVYGSKTNWYRNLKINPKIMLKVNDFKKEYIAKLLEDKKDVEQVIEMFKEKYGEREIKKWYSGFDAAVKISL